MKRRIGHLVFFLVISLLSGFLSSRLSQQAVISGWDYEDTWLVRLQGFHLVEETEDASLEETGWETVKHQLILTFLTGEHEGQTFPVETEHLSGSQLRLIKGATYILVVDRFDDGHTAFSLSDRFRFPHVVGSIVGMAVFLCLSSGLSGTRALLGLILSLFLLVKISLPLILKGYSPLLTAIMSIGGVSALTIMLVLKKARYWPVAFIGALGGAIAASLLGGISIFLWQVSGLAMEGGTLLASIFPGIDLEGILLASVIIGSIGAVLDVAISITSSMSELYEYDQRISASRLMKAGLNVGKDILGSMINTLILAYFGSSLVISLLIIESVPVAWSILNDPMISAELVKGLAGTAGLLLTVPITSIAGSWWIGKVISEKEMERLER